MTSDALIGLGANLPSGAGDPAETLVAAIVAMHLEGLVIRAVSRFFTTPCFPPGAGPDYVNAAVTIRTAHSPEQILELLHRVEHRFGRERQERWGMRTLDLDLLAVGDRVSPDRGTQTYWRDLPAEDQRSMAPGQLILPHPRLQDRGFVLVPLADIAPHWVHPLLGQPVSALLAARPEAELAEICPI